MTIPDYQSLMLPVLVASSKGEVRIGDVVNQLAEQLKLSPEERTELLPSGRQTIFSNRVHWAKTFLAKAHFIEMPQRGYFKITARGQGVLQSPPVQIDNGFLMQFPEFREFKKKSSGADEESRGNFYTRIGGSEADAR
jgi:restriction system protein